MTVTLETRIKSLPQDAQDTIMFVLSCKGYARTDIDHIINVYRLGGLARVINAKRIISAF